MRFNGAELFSRQEVHVKNTVLIVYNSGAYGSYLHWALQFLILEKDIIFDPFTDLGTSHKGLDSRDFSSIKFKLFEPRDWGTYLNTDLDLPVAKIHPKDQKTDDIKKNIQWFVDTTKSVILLYPTPEVKILAINNWIDKVNSNWWDWQISIGEIDLCEISKRWNRPLFKNQQDIPQWIKREFLSYYLLPSWEDQVDWYLPDNLQNDMCLIIPISDLLSNFLSTIEKIKIFSGLDYKKDPKKLLQFHHKMLSLQKNLGQDLLHDQIIHCTLNDKKLDWTNQYLSLTTESLIQYTLRKHGYEMTCDGLDKFPTNNVDLKKNIYQI